jgi:hypothetical protein
MSAVVIVTLATNRLQILLDGVLKSSVSYQSIDEIILLKDSKLDTTVGPAVATNVQYILRMKLRNGSNEDILLGAVSGRPTWTNDAAGYAIAEAAIYAAFP